MTDAQNRPRDRLYAFRVMTIVATGRKTACLAPRTHVAYIIRRFRATTLESNRLRTSLPMMAILENYIVENI